MSLPPSKAPRPYLTYTIIAVCIVVWLGERANLSVYDHVALYRPLVASRPWTILTSGFAHDPYQITHILFNMMSLYYLGTYLENTLGRVKYGLIYLVSVLSGSAAFIAFGPSEPVTGASGGIFGLMTAAIIIGYRRHTEVNSLIGLLVFNVFITFTTPGIAWQSHVGGALAGTLCALLVDFRDQDHHLTMQASSKR